MTNTKFPMRVASYAGAVVLCAVTTACTPDSRVNYSFKVIDSETALPAQGVRVSVNGYGHYHNNRLFPGTEDGSGSPTDANGVTTVVGLIEDDWTYYIHFRKAEYQPTEIVGVPSSRSKEWWLFYADSERDASFKKRGGDVTIDAHKVNSLLLHSSSE